MALSDDQKALLRLLAQREQGYDDIAALKGMSVEAVREEVRAALAEMDAPPEPPPPAPAPEPEPVKQPETVAAAAAGPTSPSSERAPRTPGSSVAVERRRIVAIAGGGLAIVAVVLGAVAIFGGTGSGSGESPSASAGGAQVAAVEDSKVTQAVLEAADGSDASGQAVFGRVGKEEIVLQVTAEGLEPTEKGQSYTVWLYRSPKLSLRIGSVQVGDKGDLGARFAIPAELLAYVASGAFDQVYVSRTSDAAYQREVAKAKKDKSLPRYTGETVLTGKITGPIAKAGKKGN